MKKSLPSILSFVGVALFLLGLKLPADTEAHSELAVWVCLAGALLALLGILWRLVVRRRQLVDAESNARRNLWIRLELWMSAIIGIIILGFHLYTMSANRSVLSPHSAAINNGHIHKPLDPFVNYFAYGFPFIAFLVVGMVAWWQYRQAQGNMAALAARLGFQFKPSTGPWILTLSSVEGRHRGYDVRFFTHPNPVGKKNHRWSAVAATLPQPSSFIVHVVPNLFRLRLAKHMSIISDTLGGTSQMTKLQSSSGQLAVLRTEDSNFDEAFSIKTNNPELAKSLLTVNVRDRLLESRQQGLVPILRMMGNEVRYSIEGSLTNQQRVEDLISRMELVCNLSEKMEQSRVQPSPSYT